MQCDMNPALVVIPVVFMVLLIVGMFLFAACLVKLILWWRIFSKAGYSGAFSLLILAPFGTLIMLCVLAFSNWPIAKKTTQQL